MSTKSAINSNKGHKIFKMLGIAFRIPLNSAALALNTKDRTVGVIEVAIVNYYHKEGGRGRIGKDEKIKIRKFASGGVK